MYVLEVNKKMETPEKAFNCFIAEDLIQGPRERINWLKMTLEVH